MTTIFLKIKPIYFFFGCILLLAIACSKGDVGSANSSTVGTGGSLARFTIVNNYLYLVDDYALKVFDISTPSSTKLVNTVPIGFGVETIYPYGDKLFIGSINAMFIYSLTNPSSPEKLAEARHTRSCDPVVAKDTVAFVTLKGGTACGPAQDGLYTYNIKNITTPILINTLPLPKPRGLGYKDTTLFVCCEDSGLAVVNIKNIQKPTIATTIRGNSFYDVIPLNNVLVCMVKTGIELYDIANVNNIKKINTINN